MIRVAFIAFLLAPLAASGQERAAAAGGGAATLGVPRVDHAASGVPRVDQAVAGASRVDQAASGVPRVDQAAVGASRVDQAASGVPRVDQAAVGASRVDQAASDASRAEETPPPRVDEAGEWARVTPAQAGLDRARLERGIERLRARKGTRVLVVVRDGRLVATESWGLALDESHDLKSASKSLLGLLTGIAIDRGVVESIDVRVSDVLGDGFPDAASERARALRVRDLLTMTAGLASTSGEHYGRWVSSEDWTRAALERPPSGESGEDFIYSTGNTHVLSAALESASGKPTETLARELLLDPIGARVAWWQQSPEGVAFGGNSVTMSALDLARVGHLVARGGRWGTRQIVPVSWIDRSAEVHSQGWPWRYGAYGFLWWHPPGCADAIMAVGYGGQFLVVDRASGVVVVLLSTHDGKGLSWDQEVLSVLREDFLGAVMGGS